LSKKAKKLRKKLEEREDSDSDGDEEEEYKGTVPKLAPLTDDVEEEAEEESTLGKIPVTTTAGGGAETDDESEKAGGVLIAGEEVEIDDEGEKTGGKVEEREEREDDAMGSVIRQLEEEVDPNFKLDPIVLTPPPKPKREKDKKVAPREEPYRSPPPKTRPGKDAEALRVAMGQPREFGSTSAKNNVYVVTDSKGNSTPYKNRNTLPSALKDVLNNEIKRADCRVETLSKAGASALP
jgi:hypothetical protein